MTKATWRSNINKAKDGEFATGLFRLYDIDNDGSITKSEMTNILTVLCHLYKKRPSIQPGQVRFRRLDSIGSGLYNFLITPKLKKLF